MNESDIAKNLLLDRACHHCIKSIQCCKIDKANLTCDEWEKIGNIKIVQLGNTNMMYTHWIKNDRS